MATPSIDANIGKTIQFPPTVKPVTSKKVYTSDRGGSSGSGGGGGDTMTEIETRLDNVEASLAEVKLSLKDAPSQFDLWKAISISTGVAATIFVFIMTMQFGSVDKQFDATQKLLESNALMISKQLESNSKLINEKISTTNETFKDLAGEYKDIELRLRASENKQHQAIGLLNAQTSSIKEIKDNLLNSKKAP